MSWTESDAAHKLIRSKNRKAQDVARKSSRKNKASRMGQKKAEMEMTPDIGSYPGLPAVPDSYGTNSALSSGQGVPVWYGSAETQSDIRTASALVDWADNAGGSLPSSTKNTMNNSDYVLRVKDSDDEVDFLFVDGSMATCIEDNSGLNTFAVAYKKDAEEIVGDECNNCYEMTDQAELDENDDLCETCRQEARWCDPGNHETSGDLVPYEGPGETCLNCSRRCDNRHCMLRYADEDSNAESIKSTGFCEDCLDDYSRCEDCDDLMLEDDKKYTCELCEESFCEHCGYNRGFGDYSLKSDPDHSEGDACKACILSDSSLIMNAETFEAMGTYDPSGDDRDDAKAQFSMTYPGFTMSESSLQYLVYQSGSSNKFHMFWLAQDKSGGWYAFSGYARIGYAARMIRITGPTTQETAMRAMQSKINKKVGKGYTNVSRDFGMSAEEAGLPVIPDSYGTNSALSSGQGVPVWYGSSESIFYEKAYQHPIRDYQQMIKAERAIKCPKCNTRLEYVDSDGDYQCGTRYEQNPDTYYKIEGCGFISVDDDGELFDKSWYGSSEDVDSQDWDKTEYEYKELEIAKPFRTAFMASLGFIVAPIILLSAAAFAFGDE